MLEHHQQMEKVCRAGVSPGNMPLIIYLMVFKQKVPQKYKYQAK